MNAEEESSLRVGSWILITNPDGTDSVCFTYVDAAKGLCAKGGPPNQADLGTRPSDTFASLPWPNLRWRFLSADEMRRLRLPTPPDWVQYCGPQPRPGVTWDPRVDDPSPAGRPRSGSGSVARSPRPRPPLEPWKIGDDIDGFLRVEQILGGPGRSGMGTVYVGYGSMIGGVCAAKTLQEHLLYDAALRARFHQEALTWIRLDAHDNVVQAYIWHVLRDRPCLFMEYVDGGDLSRWIGTPALLDHLDLVLRLAIDFCNGMIHAATKGLHVHRDVKPQNCLITSGDVPMLKITDFGLAKAFDDSAVGARGDTADPRFLSVHATQYGQAVGTCTHMAPEQFVDARRADVRSDVYAFGVMLHQMVTGRLPFEGRTWQDYHRLHATALPPPLPPGTPQELEALIGTSLAKDPAKRAADFSVVRSRLMEIFGMRFGDLRSPSDGARPLARRQLSNKATSLGFLGRSEDALSILERIIEENPDDAGADWVSKVRLLRRLGRHEEALASAEEAASSLTAGGVSNAVAWWSLWQSKGEVLWALGRLEEALACFDRALELDDSIDIGWLMKARILSALERHGDAADSYRRLLELAPNDPDDWSRLGDALRKAGRPGEAVPAFDRAISLEPRSLEAWANRGLALAAQGGQDDAESMVQALYSMDQALGLRPDHAEVWLNKAMLLVFYKRPREALSSFAEARRLGHPSAAAMIEAVETQIGDERSSGGRR